MASLERRVAWCLARERGSQIRTRRVARRGWKEVVVDSSRTTECFRAERVPTWLSTGEATRREHEHDANRGCLRTRIPLCALE